MHVFLISNSKDRLEGHLVVTRECLKEELNWHEPHHSQLTQQQQSSEHHSRDLKIQTEIEEEEKAEEEGLSKIENKSDIRRFTNKLQTRIRDANLTGSNIVIRILQKCVK